MLFPREEPARECTMPAKLQLILILIPSKNPGLWLRLIVRGGVERKGTHNGNGKATASDLQSSKALNGCLSALKFYEGTKKILFPKSK